MFKRILAATGDQPGFIRDAARSIAGRVPDAEVEAFHLDSPRPKDVLDQLLHHISDTQADLLVVGAHRHIIARRAAMLAPASVLMVPDGLELRFERILVPVDFSESSAEALRCAVDLADGAPVYALAVECDDEPWLDWADDHGRVQEHLSQFVNRVVRAPNVRSMVEPLNRTATMLHGTDLSPAHRIEGSDVAATIVAAGERLNASLIVMSTRGRTVSASMLLGSVTEQVMQQARGPVLALKPSGAPMNLAKAVLARLRENTPALTAS